MKHKLLYLLFLLFSCMVHAQSITENFDNVAGLSANGWVLQNNSPVPFNSFFQNFIGTFPSFPQGGSASIGANFYSTNSPAAETISNWLIMPARTLQNGDVLRFYTISKGAGYPDRLQVRLSLNGTSSNVGTTATSVGDFTTLLLTVNPTLITQGYPVFWTQYTVTLSGLPAPTTGRFAFRYFVTDGGFNGTNSDWIGIDAVEYVPVAFTITPESFTNVSCPGGSNGSATIAVPAAGTAPYTYDWSGGTYG